MPSASPVTAMPHGPPAPATFARRTKQPILPAGKLRRFWSLHDVQEREDLRHPDAGADRLSAVPHLLERRIGDHGDPADRRGFLYHRGIPPGPQPLAPVPPRRMAPRERRGPPAARPPRLPGTSPLPTP